MSYVSPRMRARPCAAPVGFYALLRSGRLLTSAKIAPIQTRECQALVSFLNRLQRPRAKSDKTAGSFWCSEVPKWKPQK